MSVVYYPEQTDAKLRRVLVQARLREVAERVMVAIPRVDLDSNIIMDSIQLSEIAFSENITDTLLLNSRRDLRKALRDIVAGRSHDIDKARLSWIEDGRTVAIHLSNAGSVRLEPEDLHLLPLLRASLPRP